MNAYKVVRDAYYDGTEDSLSKKALLLAYLQLHLNEPGLHPDDALDPDCGYSGWYALLVHRVHTTMGNLPDTVKYPTAPLRYRAFAYDQLIEFHADDDDNEFLSKVDSIYNWLEYMTVLSLHTTVQDLEDLVMFHDGAPEDVFDVLSELCEVLHWIDQFNN